jgi:hypothetical protein
MNISSGTRRVFWRLGIGVALAVGGTLVGQRWLEKVRIDAVATPSPAQKAPYPATLDKIAMALKTAPTAHIVVNLPEGQESRWESWRDGTNYRHEGMRLGRFSDGKRHWFIDRQKKWAWVCTDPQNPALPEIGLVESPPRPFLFQAIADSTLDAYHWKESTDTIQVQVAENGLLNEHTLIFDPQTKLPKEEIVEGPVGLAPVKAVKLDFATPSPVPTPNMTPPPRKRIARYTFDYGPIPAATFAPPLPSGLRLYDLDAIRTTWKARLAKEKARIELGGKTLIIREVTINEKGDVFVFYTGRLPEQHVKVKVAREKASAMYGVLEVEDSLGNKSGPRPSRGLMFGNERLPNIRSTAAYEVFGQRDVILLMQEDFPPTTPTSGDGMSYLAIRWQKDTSDPRPRTITLRFVLIPRDEDLQPLVKEYTTELLTPSGAGMPDIVVPYTTTSSGQPTGRGPAGRLRPPPP